MVRYGFAKWLMCGVVGGLALACTTGLLCAAAQSKLGLPGKLSANVALASEYIFRGLSQTDGKPAVQGGFDYQVALVNPAKLYAGVWASSVDFGEPGNVDGATVEMDLYGGLKGKIGRSGISWEAGFIYYTYPGAASGLNYDYWEVKIAAGFDFGFAALTGSVNYTTDNFANSGEAAYSKLGIEVPIPGVKGLSLNGHLAEQTVERNGAFGSPDYIEWNIGAGYNVAGMFDVSINYSDTDISPAVDGKNEAIYVSVGKRF